MDWFACELWDIVVRGIAEYPGVRSLAMTNVQVLRTTVYAWPDGRDAAEEGTDGTRK